MTQYLWRSLLEESFFRNSGRSSFRRELRPLYCFRHDYF